MYGDGYGELKGEEHMSQVGNRKRLNDWVIKNIYRVIPMDSHKAKWIVKFIETKIIHIP